MNHLIEMMKQISLNATSSSSPMSMELARVTQASPDLQIVLTTDDKLIINKDVIVIAEHLTPHKRKITLSHDTSTATTITSTNSHVTSTTSTVSSNSVTDTMSPAGTDSHIHDITALGLNSATVDIPTATVTINAAQLDMVNGYINYVDDLKVGQYVMVMIFSGGQRFYIADRVAFSQ